MISDDKRAIALEIANLSQPARLGENEITTRIYSEVNGIAYGGARTALEQAIATGVAERRRILHKGHWCWAYRMVTGE